MENAPKVEGTSSGTSALDAGLGVAHTMAIVRKLNILERNTRLDGNGEDSIWRTAKAAREEIERLQGMMDKLILVMSAAVALVCAPGWSGVSDEDCDLEEVLRRTGFVTPNDQAQGAGGGLIAGGPAGTPGWAWRTGGLT